MTDLVLAHVDHVTDPDARMDAFLHDMNRFTLDEMNAHPDTANKPNHYRVAIATPNWEWAEVLAWKVGDNRLWVLLKATEDHTPFGVATVRVYWENTYMYGKVDVIEEEW